MPKISKLIRCLSHPSFLMPLIKHRVAAGVEHCKVLKELGPIRTVLDVGANKGQFALAARSVFPHARIYSFEPMSGACALFQKVHGADSAVRLFDAAIGEKEDSVEINVSARDDSSSLLPITTKQTSMYPGTHRVGTQVVKVRKLTQLLSHSDIEEPALLKIDVQGYELQVLKGCEEALSAFRFIYVECSSVEFYATQALATDVQAWLKGRGYVLRGIHNPTLKAGEVIQADYLYERPAQPGNSG